MIEINDLHFRYDKRSPEVLCGVDLKLGAGEIGILLGKNGAGKSTLFANILGIEKPSAGGITLDGVSLIGMNARKRARLIAYVPQVISFGALTVYQSVLMGRIAYFGLRASEEDHRITEEIIAEMGLCALAERNADTLSGGEKQKVAIARAIAQEPKVMIFDEPTGNLDMANERLLIEEARKLAHRKNITILIALHDLNTALEIGDKFFFMKDGAIRVCGGTEAVTEEAVRDTFGVAVRIVEIEHRKIMIGRNPI